MWNLVSQKSHKIRQLRTWQTHFCFPCFDAFFPKKVGIWYVQEVQKNGSKKRFAWSLGNQLRKRFGGNFPGYRLIGYHKWAVTSWPRVIRGDEILPSYMEIVISHYKNPGSLLTNQNFMECQQGFERCSSGDLTVWFLQPLKATIATLRTWEAVANFFRKKNDVWLTKKIPSKALLIGAHFDDIISFSYS